MAHAQPNLSHQHPDQENLVTKPDSDFHSTTEQLKPLAQTRQSRDSRESPGTRDKLDAAYDKIRDLEAQLSYRYDEVSEIRQTKEQIEDTLNVVLREKHEMQEELGSSQNLHDVARDKMDQLMAQIDH